MGYRKSILTGFSFFGLVVSIAFATFYFSLGNCPSGSLSCDGGKSCIPQKLICNFENDCKDGKDERKMTCGNFYGSDEMTNADVEEGERSRLENIRKYNYTFLSPADVCLYPESEIPENCSCKILYHIRCYDVIRIPEQFPKETVMINLVNNKIDLHDGDTFGSYPNLTYLSLANNSITRIPPRFLYNAVQIRKLFLQHNNVSTIPNDFFTSLRHLRWLMLDHNNLRDFNLYLMEQLNRLQFLRLNNNNLTLRGHRFPPLKALNELFLNDNQIEELNNHVFEKLDNLTLLSLRNNHLTHVRKEVFRKMRTIQEIRLSGNPIVQLEVDSFLHLARLNALYLDNLRISFDENLLSTLNVSFLSLRGISYEKINFGAIEKIENLKHIVYEKFIYCSNTPSIKVCLPKVGLDGLSSVSDILEKKSLRYAVWFMAIITFVGNASVLWGRFRDENRNVSIVIRNLAFSDMIMGVYLLLVGYMDWMYRDSYHQNSGEWIKSWKCIFLGVLAMTSSEVSILILTFMSIERFLLISDPFGHHRLDTKNVILALYIIWILGLFIAILPVILFHSSTKFYGIYNGPTCFPLFIVELFPTGWMYSAFVFFGINFTLLLLIAILYAALILSIYRTRRRATSLNFFDCEFAIRFFFIVLTDACCWMPIIILKLLAFYDVEISGDVSAWLIIFILPLNAAVNPFLFTYTTPKYRDQIFAALTIRRKSSKNKQEVTNSNQNTAEDSQTKVSLLYNSSVSISKWKNFLK